MIGLVDDERYERYLNSKEAKELEIARLKETKYKGSSLADLLKHPENTYESLAEIDPLRPALSDHVKTKVEVEIKYEGYISKQIAQVERFKKLENKTLSSDIDYTGIEGIRLEAREKLQQLKPRSVGQASRISGVSPADINVLLVYLEKNRRSKVTGGQNNEA